MMMFIFVIYSDCLTVIDLNETSLMESNHSLTDGEYHFAEARRSGPTGRLIVDHQYEGQISGELPPLISP